ncbi:Peptidase S8/S53 domain [Dillenia turbinata]|uniref:Peptidase S8/S53 domain n=1 Tax=Dillenia turbinata TaxID=194707 RepID=A0AAN8VV67_9MAGN
MARILMKWLIFLTIYLTLNPVLSAKDLKTKKTYIIQMDRTVMPKLFSNHREWYSSAVKSVLSRTEKEDVIEDRIIYNYDTAFHGVAALLTEDEARRLEKGHGVVGVFSETIYRLHTTRSPIFLGLEPADSTSDWSKKLASNDVIVGVLDTGIWPESPSFNDSGMKQVPTHWKGDCETGRAFSKHHCNRKIVGARVFYHGYEAVSGKINEQEEYKSPRDQDGHGTHTAATVAGSPVPGANLLGYAYGTARGMAPGARVAAYKVCWVGGCFSSDILSAVDRAVADGVNILSISLGGGVSSYYRDSLAIAAFGAMEMGVFVSCSAGNGGPDPITLTNVSPWITTVGASTMDRDFPARIKLGTGRTVRGVSLYRGRKNLLTTKQYPIVYMGSNSSSPEPSSLCLEATLDPKAVAGKIVICDRGISPRVQKGNLNYPAISAVFPEKTSITALTLHRTVTNVGTPHSKYHVAVSSFKGALVKVEPGTLQFTNKNQKLSYKITFTTKSRQSAPEFGGLMWTDGTHKSQQPYTITSPAVVKMLQDSEK